MLEKILNPYRNLSKDIWILSLITLINRTGAMVIPFLSLYLTKSLGFTLKQVGITMTFYGIGSLFGTWIGGKMTDKIGYHKVMSFSLLIGGILFFSLQYLESFWQFNIGIFILITFIDLFRPAMWVAINDYSTEENKTRSVTLIRLAINLGFSFGPALAGFIIASLSYKGLFWIDAITTLIAGVLLYFYLNQKTAIKKKKESTSKDNCQKLKPYKDVQFMLFWFAIFLSGVAFVQFIEILPLFYSNVIHLSEQHIGYILAMNGFLIFLTEMPIVERLEKKYNHNNLVIIGMILFAISFLVLNMSHAIEVIILGMLLLTYGEIFSFPFSNTYAIKRAKKGNQGEYMAMYAMTFSAAFIVGPTMGMYLVDHYGYATLWYVVSGFLVLACVVLLFLKRSIKKEVLESEKHPLKLKD